MIERLKNVVQKLAQAGNTDEFTQEDIQAASVALLVEVMMADQHIDESEKQQLLKSTMKMFGLSREQSESLIAQAIQRHKSLVSLYDLTHVINQQFDPARKLELLEHMWRIAYSDRRWDKYEEYLIRKVADLLYISHQDFIRTRISIQESLAHT